MDYDVDKKFSDARVLPLSSSTHDIRRMRPPRGAPDDRAPGAPVTPDEDSPLRAIRPVRRAARKHVATFCQLSDTSKQQISRANEQGSHIPATRGGNDYAGFPNAKPGNPATRGAQTRSPLGVAAHGVLAPTGRRSSDRAATCGDAAHDRAMVFRPDRGRRSASRATRERPSPRRRPTRPVSDGGSLSGRGATERRAAVGRESRRGLADRDPSENTSRNAAGFESRIGRGAGARQDATIAELRGRGRTLALDA